MASNDRMISELWFGMDVEGRKLVLIKGNIPAFAWND
jgi:hypothetical protein